jgi:hypothetical protein
MRTPTLGEIAPFLRDIAIELGIDLFRHGLAPEPCVNFVTPCSITPPEMATKVGNTHTTVEN